MREDEELTEAELLTQIANELAEIRWLVKAFWITFWVLSGITALLYLVGQAQS